MPESTPRPIDHQRLKRLVRPAKWGAGILLAIAVLGFGAVPPVARHYTTQILEDTLGREVAIERVRFNPFTLTAEVHDATIMEADGREPGLAIGWLRANFELASLVRGGPVLHELALAGVDLKLVRLADGRHNWSDVVEHLAARPPSEGEARFSIGNIQLREARVHVDDQVEGLQHEVSELTIGVPFLSNLPVKVDVFVEPVLAAKINGQPFALGGRSKPFSDDRETVVELSLEAFELAPWLPYLPFEPGFEIVSGTLTLGLELAFSQPEEAAPSIALKGQIQVDGLEIRGKADEPMISAQEIGLELADVQPLINRYHFSRLRLAQPEVDLVRLADGGFNLQKLLPPAPPAPAQKPATGKRKAPAAAAAVEAEGSTAQAAPAAAAELDFLLASARVRDGVLRFEDRSVAGGFRTRIGEINLDLRDLANTGDMPAEIRLDYVGEGGEKLSHQDSLRLQPFELEGDVVIEQLQPARYGAYLAAALPGGEVRDGRIDGTLHYRVSAGDAPEVELEAETLTLSDFVLGLKGNKADAVKVPQLVASKTVLQLNGRKLSVGDLAIKGAAVSAVRQRDGSLDLARLGGAGAGGGSAAAPWLVTVDRLALEGASIRLDDRSGEKPIVLVADGIALQVENFSTAKAAALSLDLSSRINKGGKLGARGSLSLDPFKTSLKLDLDKVDLLPLQPYVLEETLIAISRGKITTAGALTLEQVRDGSLKGRYQGDLAVADFASVDRRMATDFVRWRGLNVRGIDLRLGPFGLDVRDIALNDFYTRMILDEEGKLNLREIRPGSPEAEQAKAEAALADAAATDRVSPPVRIGRIAVRGGNIAFSDRFIRPNYDANLTGMTGELKGLSSEPDTVASLELLGKVDNAAAVKINGKLNLFRQDQYLDINASMKDFELTGLSSYSGKYVGYGIQKGKLSAEVNYRIEDRRLEARNRIFLDQLTFGDAVDSPDAVNLPVQLAVSLLKNSRGEIDIDLPVRGTMDDPEFSVFGLVMRALFNLVGKAVTAPFSLLGAAFGGGGEELSQLEFAAGAASLGVEQEEKLGVLAAALRDRPALRLEITGLADPASDTEGIRQLRLVDKVRAAKLQATLKRGEPVPSLEDVELPPEEYEQWLEEAYDNAEIKKPRNLIGLAKSLPRAEMEALLLASIEVGPQDLAALAKARAQAVRDWLVDSGEIAADRIFLVVPTAGEGTGGERLVRFSLR